MSYGHLQKTHPFFYNLGLMFIILIITSLLIVLGFFLVYLQSNKIIHLQRQWEVTKNINICSLYPFFFFLPFSKQTGAVCTRDLAISSHPHATRDIRSLAIHRRHVYKLPGRLQLTFRLKTWCKWRLLWLNFNDAAHGHLDYTTESSMETFCVCFVFFFLYFIRGHHSL